MDNLISIILFMPLVAAIILMLFLRGDDPAAQQNAKWLALLASGVTFLISLFLIVQFDPAQAEPQFTEDRPWLFGLRFHVGVDGISVLFVLMTTALMPLAVLAAWSITTRVKHLIVALLLFESLILGCFVALDLVLFFLFVELALLPMLVILGGWGGARSPRAALKLILYALPGSVLMLFAVVAMVEAAGTACLAACGEAPSLADHAFATTPVSVLGRAVPGGLQSLLWLGFFASFAVKMSLFPFHAWLGDAQAQAARVGAFLLQGLLLQLGGYGLLRINLPLLPEASALFAPAMLWLAAAAVLYGALTALAETCMKRRMAAICVALTGFVLAGLFSGNAQGLNGAVIQMLSLALISGGLFVSLGALEDRLGTTDIAAFGGLFSRMPVFAGLFLVLILASIGLPGSTGFVAMLLVLLGAFQAIPLVAALAMVGLVVLSVSVLGLYRQLVQGDLIKEKLKAIPDLDLREGLILAPLVLAVLILGIFPGLVTDLIGASTSLLVP